MAERDNRNDRQQINRDMARMFRQQYRGEALARTMASIESGRGAGPSLACRRAVMGPLVET